VSQTSCSILVNGAGAPVIVAIARRGRPADT
jgi:hypothetical protein